MADGGSIVSMADKGASARIAGAAAFVSTADGKAGARIAAHPHRQDDMLHTSVKVRPKRFQGRLRATRCIHDVYARRKVVVIARGQRAALANDALAATAPI